MKRLDWAVPFAGGYVDVTPGGFFAVDVGGGIQTPGGLIPFSQPGMFLRLGPDLSIMVAGGFDDLAWRWAGEWVSHGQVYGMWPVIYAGGSWSFIRRPTDWAAGQGYRYWNGSRIVSGDETLQDIDRKICEWTERGGIRVGISYEDWLIAILPDGSYRLIEQGFWDHVQFYREGEMLAICGVRLDVSHAVAFWMTTGELAALPRYTPPGVEEPEEPEEPVSIPNRIDVVNAVDATHPDLLNENSHESASIFTERVVLELHERYPHEEWGHVGKRPGQNQHMHWPEEDITGHAVDAIMMRARPDVAIDIITKAGDGPGLGGTSWGEKDGAGQPWLPPIPLEDGGGGGGPEEPPTGECTCQEEIAELRARVEVLEAAVASLQQAAIRFGSKVALRTDNGHVVCSEGGGGGEVNATRTVAGSWERFTLEP